MAARFIADVPITAATVAGELPLVFNAAKYPEAAKAAELAGATTAPTLDPVMFAWVIGASLLGGFILNLMPCVLPVIGRGGYQNMLDVLHLKGVDLGITQSNILSYLKKTGEFGANIDQRVAFITKLYNEEMHVLAGPGINRIQDLGGKKVNLSDIGSGTQFSARRIFELLGIRVDEVNMGQADGYQKVKSGEIAATILIAGKPTGSFGKFKLEPGMTLLPVPYTEVLEQDYFPAKLTSEDYPALIPKGGSVNTVEPKVDSKRAA